MFLVYFLKFLVYLPQVPCIPSSSPLYDFLNQVGLPGTVLGSEYVRGAGESTKPSSKTVVATEECEFVTVDRVTFQTMLKKYERLHERSGHLAVAALVASRPPEER